MAKSLKKYNFKILLLGTENSGKTTFLTKMRFMFNNQLSPEEMVIKYKKVIFNQLVISMQTFILDLIVLGLEFETAGMFFYIHKLIKILFFQFDVNHFQKLKITQTFCSLFMLTMTYQIPLNYWHIQSIL